MLTIHAFTRHKVTAAAFLALSGTLLGSGAHAAQPIYDFTLDNNGILTIARPTTGTTTSSLLGTVTNFTGDTLDFRGYSIGGTFDQANDHLQPGFSAPIFTTLDPFAVFHGALTEFTVTPTTPLGLYNLNGGATTYNTVNLSANGLTISRNYSVNVVSGTAPAVPEPSSLAVLGFGALGIGALVLRRKSVRA